MTNYDSHQTQAGGSVSTSGASANAAYNSAKLNTAQVEKQTSMEIGKGGMAVKVHNNTHLDGAIISSEANQKNNRLETGTLTTSDIQNYSELETRSGSISGGTNGINPMSALSLLGNKNESEQSTTKAAAGKNINITLTKDPHGETTLQNLNHDTEHANQKVKKHDINEAKETQELVKGIGEIAEKAMQIYTYNEREAVEKAKLEAGKVATRLKNEGKSDKEIAEHPDYAPLKAAWDNKQKHYDENYGTGSTTKRAVDAVTAALQGLAAKDINQAAVGLVSPYLNEQIKKYTQNADGTVNPQANLMAHALLGAVEAAATGNNALAGAAAGAGSEVVAKFITETLYQGKASKDLTEAEKQNVVFLSQLAGGLAAGLIGDSTQSVAVGADVGKRAVENNSLHISNNGVVAKNIDDGDMSIYQYNFYCVDNTECNKKDLEPYRSSRENVGEIMFADSFISPETKKDVGVIYLGQSIDDYIYQLDTKAWNEFPFTVAWKSTPNGEYDIKSNYLGHEGKSYHGFLFQSKYISLRDAGNILAGMNAAVLGKSFDEFQKMSGALQQAGTIGILKHMVTGKIYGDEPMYGELKYQYYKSKYGYELGEERVKNKK
ncbi:VENN motif pre-toxin domain-containing protein [Pasteurella bettyae]|uniref:Putative hemagglutinin n=1 Tax=Pasteurella bettyae CCUG 2042 TaxID=1095749 RepID=I3DGQ0_9PAST|nr:VENN motif pre-toxin domain-containing protein [Pasteurella bettyae]EIJ70893.1 putative hemagglutinin [Pasteurella bettyae CCUG 2042]SUB22687.1 Possible hemagglutinin (DUF638) [Pasteurella bettyae]